MKSAINITELMKYILSYWSVHAFSINFCSTHLLLIKDMGIQLQEYTQYSY